MIFRVSYVPQPGLPLGFLLSVKGIGWCSTSRRFPRNGPPVPPAPVAGSPKTAFQLHKKTPWFQKRKPLFSDTQQRSRRDTAAKMIVRTSRIFFVFIKSSKITKIVQKHTQSRFWAEKKPLRECPGVTPQFFIKKSSFGREKKPLRECPGVNPRF